MEILGFEYPEDCLFDLDHDMWCRKLEDGSLQIGVTAFGAYLSGDFYMCRPRAPGTRVERGGKLGVAELSKTIVAIKSPLSGTIVEINPLLEDSPEAINRDPYGSGWVVRLLPACLQEESAALSHGAGLEAAALARMQLEPIEFPLK
ncbi:MAG TPA: glycine cleavage system protein H [Rhodocyclaceae bacterium]|nr:glycine cleavage system protein H [Rhodocyclaceae bacterium]